MLVLTRRQNEAIVIANNIKITVVSVGPGRVKLGIEAPSDVRIDRQEIHEKIEHSSDVLASLGGVSAHESHNTSTNHGPDTALIVPAPVESQPKNPAGEPVRAGRLDQFRRKPR